MQFAGRLQLTVLQANKSLNPALPLLRRYSTGISSFRGGEASLARGIRCRSQSSRDCRFFRLRLSAAAALIRRAALGLT